MAPGTHQDDLVGTKHAHVMVLERTGLLRRRTHSRCLCDCGREVFVDGSKIRNGHTRSCRCIRRGTPQPRKRKGYGESLRNKVLWTYRAERCSGPLGAKYRVPGVGDATPVPLPAFLPP